ncbi:hypothetical protein AB0D32_24100 [Micromonospora sp. NPDC048170]|uniref:PHP domain-containing protein n=1 Tax=Micromonospora sp. NPDC048170 TaxID=3154819 RepID=UPI0033FFBE9A
MNESPRLYDLHVHTTNSDGRWTPEEVLSGAGHLAGLAITDHSGLTWSDKLATLARDHGTQLLFPGMEISTTHKGNKYHVLAYGRGIREPDFEEFAFHPTRTKNAIYMAVLAELRREGFALPDGGDILAAPEHPGKWMLSKTLIGGHLVAAGMDPDEARRVLTEKYDRLKQEHPDRYLPTIETIRRVREVGGVPAIAHAWWECPSGRNSWAGVGTALAEFRAAGLLGLEVSTRHVTVGTEAERREVAAELGLVPTAGSDFHANGKTALGQFGLDEDEMAEFRRTAEAAGCLL